jgi:hypothetical protein
VAAPEPKRSTLVVHAPAGSHVGVDGRELVVQGGPLRIDVAGGEHRVVVAAPHKLVWSGTVRVAAGASADLRPTLSKARPSKSVTPPPAATASEAPPASSPQTKVDTKVEQKAEPKPDAKKSSGDYTLDPF